MSLHAIRACTEPCGPDEKCLYVVLANEDVKVHADLSRQVVAECIGSTILVAVIVGSGIQAENLSDDVGVSLLGNTIATLGILYVLITVFGKISGAHFNPVVTLAFFLRREMSASRALAYIIVQFAGAILGTLLAHGMFELEAVEFDAKDRDSIGEFVGEIVATFGLLLTIFGCIGSAERPNIPLAVGLYITAGYWFTSSTAFANPAVTVGRGFTSTFAGIKADDSIGIFIGGQLVGFLVGFPFVTWMFDGVSIVDALKLFARIQLPALEQQPTRSLAPLQIHSDGLLDNNSCCTSNKECSPSTESEPAEQVLHTVI